MALDFKIKQNSDCSIEYCNLSSYCTGTSYTADYCIAFLDGWTKISTAVVGGEVSYMFYGGALTTGTAASTAWLWTKGAVTGATQNMVFTLAVSTTTTITLRATDSNSLVSTMTMKIKLDASGDVEWVAAPSMRVTPGSSTTLSAYFTDWSNNTDTDIDETTDSLALGDATTVTSFPVNHTYATAGTKSLTYSYNEDTDNEAVSNAFQYKLTTVSTTCTSLLTEDNITAVNLRITDPNGLIENYDITDEFLEAPFKIENSDFEFIDLETSGIYDFQTIVTKTDGNIYIFSKSIKVVIICSLKCQYSKLLSSKTGLSSNCQSCDEITLNQLFNIDIYYNGLLDLIACNDTEGINNTITILTGLLSNVNCNCS